MKHTGTVPFETERLVCRRFEAYDWRDMLENWASLPEIQTEYGEPVYTDEAKVRGLLDSYIRSYEKPDFYRWAITERSSGRNIGQIAFCKVWEEQRTAEIEYCIGTEFWGKDYAGEALVEKSMMHTTDTVQRFVHEGVSPEGEVCYCIEKDVYMNIINERSC